jgi:hypothetical protein
VNEQGGRRALGDGAARAAPTAPHATPSIDDGGRRRTGPERFWSRRRGRSALTVGLATSLAAHLLPWALSGVPAGIDFRDLEGETALPFDVLVEQAPPPPEAARAAAPPEAPAEPPEPAAPAQVDAGLAPHKGADAGPDGAVEDGGASSRDGGSAGPQDAMADGEAVASTDAASPLEPEAIAAAVQGGPVAIEIAINAEVIRKHPVGAQMGFLLRGIPQWDDFMHGTPIDPVHDVDWILISGNSLIHTENDSVVLHYSASDEVVDRAVAIVTRKYGHGAAIDAGVPGVRASLAFADRAERVLLRPGSHLLAIVPPRMAPTIARQLSGRRISPPLRPGEALFWKFVEPHRMLGELPEAISEMRLRIVPRADGGADVYAEGDTKDEDAAQGAAKDVARFVRRHDDPITSLVTRGVLDHVDVAADGKLVKAHLSASLDQIANLVDLVGRLIGADEPESPAPSPPPGRPAPSGARPQLR